MAVAPVMKPHALVAFGGTLNPGSGIGNQEIWQCTLRVCESPVISDVEISQISNPLSDPQAYMEWVAPFLLTEFHTTPATQAVAAMSGAATLDWLKVNNVGVRANGTFGYTSGVTHEHIYSGNTAGGQGAPGQNWLSTLCGSLRTNRVTKGPSSHGRMYLPLWLPPSNFAAVSTGYRDSAAALYGRVVRMFQCDGNGVYPHPVRPTIQSPGGKFNGHTPVFSIIDYVTVGSVVDTVRRRKNALAEAYSAKVNI